MLTRDQFKAMLMLNLFSGTERGLPRALPLELLYRISESGYEPHSDIAKALHHAAYARKEDVNELLAMLEKNPRLLLQAGNVITPGGLDVRCVTIYEFLLGAGDPSFAEKVVPYFTRIPDGEDQRLRQYKRYRPHIEKIRTQEPYDFTLLIKLIKQSSDDDVTAMVNKDMKHACELRDALIQFRKDHGPRIVREPCMYYNYRSLEHALKIIEREGNRLQKISNNYDRFSLAWNSLVGFQLRRLSGIDRCLWVQGLFLEHGNEPPVRSYLFRHASRDASDGPDAGDCFPITLSDDSLEGLGSDFAIDMMGNPRPIRPWPFILPTTGFKKFMSSKISGLLALCTDTELNHASASIMENEDAATSYSNEYSDSSSEESEDTIQLPSNENCRIERIIL